MPKFRMDVSAHFENVAAVSIPEGYPWHMVLLCSNCREKTPKPVVVTSSDVVEGVRGAAVNLRITCKLCGRVGDLKILSDQMHYTENMSPEWSPLLKLECRGMEPNCVMLADDVPLSIFGTGGMKFEDGFLEDGEYFGWDENQQVEVSITEFRTRVVRE